MTPVDDVRALLGGLDPADAREAAFVGQLRALLASDGDPFSRGHFVPGHFTASAFVLHPDRPAVLLILHGKLHRWLQPGGHFEPGDADVFAAARREVLEETGLVDLDLPLGRRLLDVDVHEIPPLKGDPAHRHYDLWVLFRSRTTAATAGSDAAGARWVPLAEVGAADSDESVLRAVAKVRALLFTG